MTNTSTQLPACPHPNEVNRIRERWVNEARRFVHESLSEVDDAEIFVKLTSTRGWSFVDQNMRALTPPPQGETYIRLFRGGHTVWGRFPLSQRTGDVVSKNSLRHFLKRALDFIVLQSLIISYRDQIPSTHDFMHF